MDRYIDIIMYVYMGTYQIYMFIKKFQKYLHMYIYINIVLYVVYLCIYRSGHVGDILFEKEKGILYLFAIYVYNKHSTVYEYMTVRLCDLLYCMYIYRDTLDAL